MISWIESKKGLNFKGWPAVRIAKRPGPFPVEVALGRHGSLHMDREAAEALLDSLEAALALSAKRGAK